MRNMRLKHPRLIYALCLLLLFTLLLESFLRLLDPFGLIYFDDLAALYPRYVADPTRGYVLPDGTYDLTHFTLTIQGGTRLVPDTPDAADCVIVLLGDSVTLGHGVQDGETFTNLLARAYPAVRFINGGLGGYNSANVAGTKRAFPANAYLYLLTHNDAAEATNITYRPKPPSLFTARLLNYLTHLPDYSAAAQRGDKTRFYADLETIVQDGHVTLAGFERSPNWIPGELLQRGYDVLLLDDYTSRGLVVSAIDPHPNAQGHALIAQQLGATVEQMIARECETDISFAWSVQTAINNTV